MKATVNIPRSEIIKGHGRVLHSTQWIKKAVHRDKSKYSKGDRRANKII